MRIATAQQPSESPAAKRGGDSHQGMVGAFGQLRCPKCRGLTLNVHVSDIIRDNGRVTCASCGHERVVMKLTNEQRLQRQGLIFNHNGKCGKITP